MSTHPFKTLMLPCAALCALMLGGCSSDPPVVAQPTVIRPMLPPTYVEKPNTGAIYQAGASGGLFQDARIPSNIGDTVKVDIAEKQSSTNKSTTKATRNNTISAKGPGAGGDSGLVKSLLNVNATASGADSFEGNGNSEQSSSYNGRITAQVINILPNGHLVIAGEKTMAYASGMNILRYSGIVNPQDIKPGGVVSSIDVVNAKLEQVGQGDISATSTRTWMQRVLTNTLTLW